MLQLTIDSVELYDDVREEFITIQGRTLQLEHSLVSVSKWESKWEKPFLSKDSKTFDETVDYIRCMTITQNVNPELYGYVTTKNIQDVNSYIDAPMTATTFSSQDNSKSREIITAEIIYYWMITMNIPMDCQKWHLNRLLTLINVCNLKNQPPKKMGRQELMNRNHKLNAQRRAALNNKG